MDNGQYINVCYNYCSYLDVQLYSDLPKSLYDDFKDSFYRKESDKAQLLFTGIYTILSVRRSAILFLITWKKEEVSRTGGKSHSVLP